MLRMNSALRRLPRRLLRRVGLDITRWPVTEPPPTDLPPEFVSIIERSRPLTLTSNQRLAATIDSVRYLHSARVPGAVVECGVWRGGHMVAAALALRSLNDLSRDLYLYDTFAGMTPPREADSDYLGRSAVSLLENEEPGTGIWCVASIEEVRGHMLATGYPEDRIHLVKGAIEETVPRVAPSRIALLRLDTDWYESTRHELQHFYPRLEPGGVLIVDDYGHWRGSRRAVDEYFKDAGQTLLLSRIDYTCRLLVKPAGPAIAGPLPERPS